MARLDWFQAFCIGMGCGMVMAIAKFAPITYCLFGAGAFVGSLAIDWWYKRKS
jgi:hypothetical protein